MPHNPPMTISPTFPLVSVIVVVADSGALTRESVARALASPLAVECILVDNASSDSIPQALEGEYAGDDRFRVLYNGANLGFGPAVNRGAELVRGEYLLVLNPDCLLEPDTLPRLVDVLAADPRNGLVGAVVHDDTGTH
jgi:N-acetylglucosaminyl-diphospho-decaprenol L-rhamnosyltransferase